VYLNVMRYGHHVSEYMLYTFDQYGTLNLKGMKCVTKGTLSSELGTKNFFIRFVFGNEFITLFIFFAGKLCMLYAIWQTSSAAVVSCKDLILSRLPK